MQGVQVAQIAYLKDGVIAVLDRGRIQQQWRTGRLLASLKGCEIAVWYDPYPSG